MNAIRVRAEILVLGAGLAAAVSVADAVWWLTAVVVHELGHGIVARALGHDRLLDLQLGAGDGYTEGVFDPRVLAAGPLVSGAAWLVLLQWGPAWPGPRFWFFQWTAFQIWPFPASDGGVLLRSLLARSGLSERWAFGVTLAVGSTTAAVAIAAVGPSAASAVWWCGLAVVLAASEWPAVVHQEAYRLYQTGRYLEAAERARGRKGARFAGLRRLGVLAADAAHDLDRLVELIDQLPPSEPDTWPSVRKLLAAGHPESRRLAERALDGYAGREESLPAPARKELAEVAAAFGVSEAYRGAHESAFGLLERAQDLGFDRFDWLEFEPALEPLRRLPRWRGLADPPRPGEKRS